VRGARAFGLRPPEVPLVVRRSELEGASHHTRHTAFHVCTALAVPPAPLSELEVNFFLLRRLLGVRSKEGEKQDKVIGGLNGGPSSLHPCFSTGCTHPLSTHALRRCLLQLRCYCSLPTANY
jgi:hypothetical protein